MSYLLRRTRSLDQSTQSLSRLSGDTGLDLWRKERIQSVLYKAVKQEDVEMAAKCLKMGAVDVNTRYEPIGQTVLHMVSITGEPRLCALFLRANADPNLADDRQFRPIHWACMQGHKTVVRILLNHGTDVRLVNEYGDAAIHTAVRHDHVHLLPYLLGQSFQSVLLPTRNGSHKEVEHVNLQNENGDGPLHIAVALGRKRMAKKLIRLGAAGHIRNNQGMTPLDLAAEKRNGSLMRLLRKNFTATPPTTGTGIFTEDSSSNISGRKSVKTPPDNTAPADAADGADLMTPPPPAPQTQAMPPPLHYTEEYLQNHEETSKTNIRRASDQKSFDLELTGRSYPSSEISKSTKTIERRSKKFCYHHHIEEPTKVVALDPLPNNSSSGPSVGLGAGGARATSGERWRATSVDTGLLHTSKSKLKKTGIGQVPVFPLHSASLEEKLNEITNRQSDKLDRRIADLSNSVQSQLELMNSNLQRQEDCIKKTVKKTIAEENKNPPIQVLPPEPPEQPPRPPLPKNIPIHVVKMDKLSPKNAKKVAINPSPSFMDKNGWITREEKICIVKKTKNEPKKRRRPLRKVSKESSSDILSSTEADESSTSLGTQISQQFDELVAKQNSNSSSLSRSHSRSTNNISRMSNYQPYSFNDVFGTRVGRVSPKIYEIQEELREAQRKAAMRRSAQEQSKSYGTS